MLEAERPQLTDSSLVEASAEPKLLQVVGSWGKQHEPQREAIGRLRFSLIERNSFKFEMA